MKIAGRHFSFFPIIFNYAIVVLLTCLPVKTQAEVAKLVDAIGLGPIVARCEGSSPSLGILTFLCWYALIII